jgi:hypothetical protein
VLPSTSNTTWRPRKKQRRICDPGVIGNAKSRHEETSTIPPIGETVLSYLDMIAARIQKTLNLIPNYPD